MAVINTALSPAYDLLGYGISKLGSKTKLDFDLLTESKNTSKKTAELYNKIKTMSFDAENRGNYYTLGRKVQDLASSMKERLSTQQFNVLDDLATTLQTTGSHGDVLHGLQVLKTKFKNFSGTNTSDSIFNTYNELKANVTSILETAASKNNLGPVLEKANTLYTVE